MSIYLRNIRGLIALCWFVVSVTVHAETWMRGSVALLFLTGEVTVQESGEASRQLHAIDPLPQHVSGLLKIQAELGNASFLKTSNQVFMHHIGPGAVAIERFEQAIGPFAGAGKSRMILHFRRGVLVLDTRALSAGSQMIVETPIGRIAANNAWWLIEMSYDEYNQTYYFSIECADGVLHLNALNDMSYSIGSGQRLNGAGLSSNPSIEASEISNAGRQLFDQFATSVAESVAFELSVDVFRAKMVPITSGPRSVSELSELSVEGRSARPLLIEYAPRPTPLIPFRAVIRPPSEHEADLF